MKKNIKLEIRVDGITQYLHQGDEKEVFKLANQIIPRLLDTAEFKDIRFDLRVI